MKISNGDRSCCGVLLLDKPAGCTSHDVVSKIRRLSGMAKVGHGGTLDPFATGLLLVLLGKATRLFDYLLPLGKTYVVEIQFGAVSTTGDSDGEITAVDGSVTGEQLTAALSQFTGDLMQRPHRYSAVKVGGEALYRKARRGEVVDAPARRVTISELELLEFDASTQCARLKVSCSKGTYIRTLCEDIGTALANGAYAASLRRTAVGEFMVEDSQPLERLQELLPREPLDRMPSFISCMGALYFLPVRELDESEIELVMSGRTIAGAATGPLRAAYRGQLLAVYGPGEGDSLRPLAVLA